MKFRGETSIERVVRESIEARGLQTEKQFMVKQCGSFDLYIPTMNVLIECDGTYWHSTDLSKRRDAIKQAAAEAKGFTVWRFSEELINSTHLDDVLTVKLNEASTQEG